MTAGQLAALALLRHGPTHIGRGTIDRCPDAQVDGKVARVLHRSGLADVHLLGPDDVQGESHPWCEITDAGRRAYRNAIVRAVPNAS